MNKLVKELKKVGVFYIATIDKDQPRVRPFGSIVEFEGNAYICSGNFKEFYKQVKENPKVELCGMYKDMSWLRVSTILVECDRIDVQKAMLDDPTGPKGLYEPGDGRFVTFRLTNIKATKYSFTSAPKELCVETVTSCESFIIHQNDGEKSWALFFENRGDKVEITYQIERNGRYEIEKTASMSPSKFIKMLNKYDVLSWDGFNGACLREHDTRIGFNFNAIINGRALHGAGYTTFPDNYEEFVEEANKILLGK